jgi:ABC-2 type transport system permease protein
MLKPLLKKQFTATTAFLVYGKNGKPRSRITILAFGVLMLYAFGASGFAFYHVAKMLCEPLVLGGLDWVYFSLVGTMATAFAVLGSVFYAKARLYEAKDNDFLLSLPIKPWEILLTRGISLYAFSFLFSAIVFVPSSVAYFVLAGVQALSVVFITLTIFILPLGAVALSAMLGWVFAVLTAKIRAKNAVIFLLTFAFMALYFWGYSKLNDYLSYLIANGAEVGAKMKTALFVFWQMGLGATGKASGFFAFAGIFIALFAVAAVLLNASFLSIITTKRSGTKNVYKEKAVKTGSAFGALVKREALRLFKNAMVCVNSILGSVFMLAMPILAIVNEESLSMLSAFAEMGLILPLLVGALGGMNILTSASVSLEGRGISNLRSYPVSAWTILLSKLALYGLLTVAPALLSILVLYAVFPVGVWVGVLGVVATLALVTLFGASGLIVNLKLPTFDWTSELTAVKQGVSTLVSMFLNIGICALLVGAYFAFGKHLGVEAFLGICTGVIVVADCALFAWLKTRGTDVFSKFH